MRPLPFRLVRPAAALPVLVLALVLAVGNPPAPETMRRLQAIIDEAFGRQAGAR